MKKRIAACVMAVLMAVSVFGGAAALGSELFVIEPPTDQVVPMRESAVFTAEVSAAVHSFTWQVSDDGGNTWRNLREGHNGVPLYMNVLGVNTATLTITRVEPHMNFFRFRISGTGLLHGNPVLFQSDCARLTISPVTEYIPFNPLNNTVVTAQVMQGAEGRVPLRITGPAVIQTDFWEWTDNWRAEESRRPVIFDEDGGRLAECVHVSLRTVPGGGMIEDRMLVHFFPEGTHSFYVGTHMNVAWNHVFDVTFAPQTITRQPENITVTAGSAAVQLFSAAAQPLAGIQWQVSADNGETWTDVHGLAGRRSPLSLPVSYDMNGNMYRAVFSNDAGTLVSDTATLTVNAAPPRITAHPSNRTVSAGDSVTFTAGASGEPAPALQWQVSYNGTDWGNIPNENSATLTIHNVTHEISGNRYRLAAANQAGTVYSNPATLTVLSPPVITRQPANHTVNAGQHVMFYVEAWGDPAPTFQWQVSSTNGRTWTNVVGGTGDSLMLTSVPVNWNGNMYRVIVSNSVATVISNAVTLTISPALPPLPVITSHPQSQTVYAGQTAAFTVAATGATSHRWQRSANGGLTWADWGSGATLNIPAITAANNHQFRAVVTNISGSVTSNAATLVVLPPPMPVITQHPSNVDGLLQGETAVFTAQASVSGAHSFRWQIYGAAGWADIPNATGTALTVPNVTLAISGTRYRFIVTNHAGTVVSNSATLLVNEPEPLPPITLMLNTTTDVEIINGARREVRFTAPETALFRFGTVNHGDLFTAAFVHPTGNAEHYNEVSGQRHFMHTRALNEGENFTFWAGVFNDSPGANGVYTIFASIVIPPSITTQPANRNVNAGQNAVFAAEVSGATPRTLQWQLSTDDGETWADILNATTATLTIENTTGLMDGNRYRLRAQNQAGVIYSNAAALTVTVNEPTAPVITRQPQDRTVYAGSLVNFGVSFTGYPRGSVQWERSTDNGFAWTEIWGATSTLLSLGAVQLNRNGEMFRVVIENELGRVYSNAARLTVNPPPPVITAQLSPEHHTVNTGGSVQFTVTATGHTSHQWQVSANGGDTWTNIAGASTSNLWLPNVMPAADGNLYRIIFRNAIGVETISRPVLLTVIPPPPQPFRLELAAWDGGSVAMENEQFTWEEFFFYEGQPIIVSAVPPEGSQFLQWHISGDIELMYPENSVAVFAMPGNDAGLTAEFTPALPTVDNVTVEPAFAEVERGGTRQFVASVNGANNPSQAVQWSVEGCYDVWISTDGRLYVGSIGVTETITVRATSEADNTVSGIAVITLTEPPPPPTLEITLNVSGTHNFGHAVVGYEQPEPLTVTVTNTGNVPTGRYECATEPFNRGGCLRVVGSLFRLRCPR